MTIEDDSLEFPVTFVVDNEMAMGVKLFLDEVNHGKEDGNVYPELNMQHSLVPELKGTADYVRINGSHGVIMDLKYGKASVTARKRNGDLNAQLMSYTSLVFDKFAELQTAEIGIIQPRRTTKSKVRKTDVTRHDVAEFMLRVQAAAEQVRGMKAGTIPPSPTENNECWYCAARRICPAKAESQLQKDFG